MQKYTLEKYRIFPYVVWIIIGGFSIFVYTLVLNLRAITADLSATTESLEAAIDKLPRSAATTTPAR